VLGMIERGGSVVIRMLENVKQKTIGPLIQATIDRCRHAGQYGRVRYLCAP
jgi:hypothetical protein